jgi:low temperature requirement protein LtrA
MANKKKNNLWWGPPRNFAERKQQRKISWLELFFDLAYVAAISQLTHHLAEHPSVQTTAFMLLLFSLIFWSWVNASQYYDLHGSDSIRTRLMTFWQMLAVISVSISLQDVFEGHHHTFVICFSIIQVLVTYLWWSVGLYDRSHRVFNKFYTVNYLLALALLIVSWFTAFDTAVILWILVLLLNLTPPLIGANTIVRVIKQRGQVFSASEALVERFGLFTIIVLTESILATVSGITRVKDHHPVAWFGFILGILIAFLIWCLYFDMTSEQETKPGYSYMQYLVFLHFPLLASLGTVGACIKVLLGNIDEYLQNFIYWLFCVALVVILLATAGIAAIMKEEEEDRAYIRPVSKILFVVSVILLIVPLFGDYFNPVAFLSIVSVILLVPVSIGIRSWVNYKFFSNN